MNVPSPKPVNSRPMRFVATKTVDQLDLQAPAKYVRAYLKGQKNDFRDAEAIAEAVLRPTLHRVRDRLVSQRTGVINQIRAFLLERGIAVRQGLRFLRTELPKILATRCDVPPCGPEAREPS